MFNITSYKSIIYNALFDDLREYCFDKNQYTGNISYKNLIEHKLTNIYEYQKEESSKFTNKKLPKSFRKKYQRIIFGNLCSYTRDLFTNNENDNYLIENGYTCSSLTGNSSNYGINVFISYYVHKIRVQKNLYDLMLRKADEYGFQYNNTLYGTKLENKNTSDDYVLNDPFQIFNYGETLRLSVMRRFYLNPFFNGLLEEFYDSIWKYWNSKYNLYLALIIILIIAITLFFIVYVIPFIYKLDQDIYKTKNMLSIIPKEVLASLRNISVLLNLSNAIKTAPSTIKKNEEKEEKKSEE